MESFVKLILFLLLFFARLTLCADEPATSLVDKWMANPPPPPPPHPGHHRQDSGNGPLGPVVENWMANPPPPVPPHPGHHAAPKQDSGNGPLGPVVAIPAPTPHQDVPPPPPPTTTQTLTTQESVAKTTSGSRFYSSGSFRTTAQTLTTQGGFAKTTSGSKLYSSGSFRTKSATYKTYISSAAGKGARQGAIVPLVAILHSTEPATVSGDRVHRANGALPSPTGYPTILPPGVPVNQILSPEQLHEQLHGSRPPREKRDIQQKDSEDASQLVVPVFEPLHVTAYTPKGRQSRTRVQTEFDERPTVKIIHRVVVTVSDECAKGTGNAMSYDASRTVTPIRSADDELSNPCSHKAAPTILLLAGEEIYRHAPAREPVTDSGALEKHPHRGPAWWPWGGPGPVNIDAITDKDFSAAKEYSKVPKEGEEVSLPSIVDETVPDAMDPTATASEPSVKDNNIEFRFTKYPEGLLDLNAGSSSGDARDPIADLHSFFRTRIEDNMLILRPYDDADIVRILSPLVVNGHIAFGELAKFVHTEANKFVMSLSQESQSQEGDEGAEAVSPPDCWFSGSVNSWISGKLLEYCDDGVLSQCPSGDSHFWECKCFGIVPNENFMRSVYLTILYLVVFVVMVAFWIRKRSFKAPVILWPRRYTGGNGKGGFADDEERGKLEDPDFYHIPELRNVHVDKGDRYDGKDTVVFVEEVEQTHLVPATTTEMAILQHIRTVFGSVKLDTDTVCQDESSIDTAVVMPRRSNQRRWTYSQSSDEPLSLLSSKAASALNKSKSLRVARPKLNAYATGSTESLSNENGRRRAVTVSKIPDHVGGSGGEIIGW